MKALCSGRPRSVDDDSGGVAHVAAPALPAPGGVAEQNPRVLILDADSRAGLACVQSLGAVGVEVHAGMRDSYSLTAQSRWCRHIHPQPDFEPSDNALDWLRALDARHAFSLIIPTTEGSLRWLHRLPETHPVRRKAQLPDDEALDIALDKSRTSELAERMGLPVPQSRRIEQDREAPATALGFPCVLKPVRSKVVIGQQLRSLAVEVVKDEVQRRVVFQSWLPYTDVQEQLWVPGRGVGVEMLFDHGRLVWSFVHERLHEYPLSGGASTLRRSAPPDPQLIAWSQQLLQSLHWHGVAMVEWRRQADGTVYLMEINPRLWGSVPLTIAAGLNVPLDLLRLAQGQTLDGGKSYKLGISARNPTGDLHWFVENWRADRSNPLLLTQTRLTALASWLQIFSGREVWDGWRLDDWRVLARDAWALLSYPPRKVAARLRDRILAARLRKHHAKVLNALRQGPRPIRKVLFVCYGNICRSAFAQRAVATHWPTMQADSAGFHAKVNRPSPAHVVQTASDLGVDLHDWASQGLRAEQIERSDLIVVMDKDNWRLLANRFPQALGKTTLLGLFEPCGEMEIPDPYNLDPDKTRLVLASILRATEALARHDIMAN